MCGSAQSERVANSAISCQCAQLHSSSSRGAQFSPHEPYRFLPILPPPFLASWPLGTVQQSHQTLGPALDFAAISRRGKKESNCLRNKWQQVRPLMDNTASCNAYLRPNSTAPESCVSAALGQLLCSLVSADYDCTAQAEVHIRRRGPKRERETET